MKSGTAKPAQTFLPSDIASISTVYDGAGRVCPGQSLVKLKFGHLVDGDGETALVIQETPQDFASNMTKSGGGFVQFTDRSNNPVWVNPSWVTKVRVGSRPNLTVIEQGVDRLPWDPIQVRESVKVVTGRVGPLTTPPREVVLAG